MDPGVAVLRTLRGGLSEYSSVGEGPRGSGGPSGPPLKVRPSRLPLAPGGHKGRPYDGLAVKGRAEMNGKSPR